MRQIGRGAKRREIAKNVAAFALAAGAVGGFCYAALGAIVNEHAPVGALPQCADEDAVGCVWVNGDARVYVPADGDPLQLGRDMWVYDTGDGIMRVGAR